MACAANNIEYVELQVAIDGLTVVVNPENTFATCLTVEELAKIYGPDSPQDLKWSDVRADFPADPVNRFMPGADSGTFDYFTEVINGEVDAATQFATPSEDDNVLVTGVAGDVNAIAFFGYAYFVENRTRSRPSRSTAATAASRRPTRRSTPTATPRSAARCSSIRTSARQRRGPSSRRSSTSISRTRRRCRPKSATWRSPTTSSRRRRTNGRPPSAADRPALTLSSSARTGSKLGSSRCAFPSPARLRDNRSAADRQGDPIA